MPTNIRGNEFLRLDDFKKGINTTDRIPHLNCPDCNSEAFGTDQPGIAMCGACPGWYFKYEQKTERGQKRYKLKMVNGELQEVPVYKTELIEEHP